MKVFYSLFFSLLLLSVIYAQEIGPQQFFIDKELNPAGYIEAKNLAIEQNLPVAIKFSEGILIEVLKVENGAPLYAVIKNFAHPLDNVELLSFPEIQTKYDLSNAEINYGNSGNEIYYRDVFSDTKLLLVADWTNDNVLSFDHQTGDLINANYIPPSPGNLASPKQARVNVQGFISVSDQITDLVQKFDTLGNYLGLLAPAGGVNNALLDNLRGHNYRPSNGNLVVAVGSGGNQNSVPEFDAAGNYIGQFITTGSGGLSSPFDILFRTSDVLVTGSSSDAAHRYDLNGNYLNNFASGIQFPQQMAQISGNRIAIAVFSSPSGLAIYDAAGTQLAFLTGVTGLRGAYELANGNFLVSNGSGVHEIEPAAGNLVRTVFSATSVQYITLADYSIIPVELTSFTASALNNSVVLNWSTATEINNSGFSVERSYSGSVFKEIAFVDGFGTTTAPHSYSYTDRNLLTGKYSYRLKQVDFDGSISYSSIVNVEIGTPGAFALEQNYPNPFNPSTAIAFSVPFDAQVSIEIFNLLGQKVKTVMNDYKQAGRYTLTFDAGDLSSGTYLYKMTAGNFSKIMKMTLVK